MAKTGEDWGCLSWQRIGLQVCPEVELWGSSGKEGILISDKGERIPGRGIRERTVSGLYLRTSKEGSVTELNE